MFTGIVEELGSVAGIERDGGSARLRVACRTVLADTGVGDSVNVNGCCLTATRIDPAEGFTADLMGETLDRTALGVLAPGDPVNLERSVPANGRLGGHLVQGHVDAVATVEEVADLGTWTRMTIRAPADLRPYLVEKGSVTVDGVSLTVAELGGDTFALGLIPHTLSVTTLGRRAAGDPVNLEADVIAKYVERMLRAGTPTPYDAPDAFRGTVADTAPTSRQEDAQP
ncbi:riboflavin synthase [Egibacter rhizosphaerae]|uniref:Riboflavin synthase n=1 Tax=Egibacter rhizosphaerae TaxID=1670831 RepID=A0A411YK40_9ACTN|nr:riboflavin synthase [Egibacter rhizosphaerae]QBI21551.1 riboflavin synthase [Egibacter rhizosphaerae]